MSKLVSIIMSVIISITSVIYGYVGKDYEHEKADGKNYKTIFVHGFNGFGDGSQANEAFAYWGGGAVNLLARLRDLDYLVEEATVGPITSCWDRTCELYAQLTGTRVDYGEAHAKAHNHARYGRSYKNALAPSWSKTNKINLIGHSFGGTTIRLLSALLADGDEAEKKATKDGSISPLFTGGKGSYVNSITTIASPINGTTLMYIGEKTGIVNILEPLFYAFGGTTENGGMFNTVFDFQLDQFSIKQNEGESNVDYMARATKYLIESCSNDSAFYDMTLEGAQAINKRCRTLKNVYYYSAPFTTTKENALGYQSPISSTFVFLRPLAAAIGTYEKNTVTDYPIDKSWLQNDGLVNTVSEKAPFGEKSVEFNFGDKAQKGMWNVFPVKEGDHGNAVGLCGKPAEILDYFTSIMDLINKK